MHERGGGGAGESTCIGVSCSSGDKISKSGEADIPDCEYSVNTKHAVCGLYR